MLRKNIRVATLCSAAAAAALCAALFLAVVVVADDDKPAAKYEPATSGTRILDGPGGITVKMLLEEANLGGGELEVGEITFPADYRKSPAHHHTSVELFYVISGKLGHEVNGTMHVIEPGMLGIVRPGDRVAHSVESDGPVRALVIWAPAGEADRLVKGAVFKSRPIDDKK
jgi:quercetin dioxygenase-like cupin family protein